MNGAQQHNDHCLIMFSGIYWRIVGMNGLSWIWVYNEEYGRSAVDLSQMDWSAYLTDAVELLSARYQTTLQKEN